MGELISFFKKNGDKILSVFTNDKLNIENMYFLISEQVSINQIKSIDDIKEIYPNMFFEQVNEIISVYGVNYSVITYIFKHKNEKLSISYVKYDVIAQIRYVVEVEVEDKINILTYNNVGALSKDADEMDKFIIEVERLSLEESSITTVIMADSILDQKEIYEEIR